MHAYKSMKLATVIVFYVFFVGELHPSGGAASVSAFGNLRSKLKTQGTMDERANFAEELEQLLEEDSLESAVTFLESYQGDLYKLFNDKDFNAAFEATHSSKICMFSLLANKFSNEEMIRAILSANNDLREKLISDLLQYWLMTTQDPEMLFNELSLNLKLSNFNERVFRIFITYVTEFNLERPVKVSLYQILELHYNEQDMFCLLYSKFPRNKGLGAVFDEVFQAHTSEMIRRGVTPAQALRYLKIPSAGVLNEQAFYFWNGYRKAFNVAHQKVSIISALLETYPADKVVYVLDSTEKQGSPKKKAFASKLKSDLLDEWHKTHTTTRDVFNQLKLSEVRYPLNVHVETWLSYVQSTLGNNQEFEHILKEIESIRSGTLVKILFSCQKFPNLKQVADELLPATIDKFLYEEKPSPDIVLAISNPDKSTLLSNRYFIKWLDYAKVYYQKKPFWIKTLEDWYGYTDIINILAESREDESTGDLALELTKDWLKYNIFKKTPPDTLFNQLDFHFKPNTYLWQNPKINMWTRYVFGLTRNRSKNKPRNLKESMEVIYFWRNIPLVEMGIKWFDKRWFSQETSKDSDIIKIKWIFQNN